MRRSHEPDDSKANDPDLNPPPRKRLKPSHNRNRRSKAGQPRCNDNSNSNDNSSNNSNRRSNRNNTSSRPNSSRRNLQRQDYELTSLLERANIGSSFSVGNSIELIEERQLRLSIKLVFGRCLRHNSSKVKIIIIVI